jgi:hypothetical protein
MPDRYGSTARDATWQLQSPRKPGTPAGNTASEPLVHPSRCIPERAVHYSKALKPDMYGIPDHGKIRIDSVVVPRYVG